MRIPLLKLKKSLRKIRYVGIVPAHTAYILNQSQKMHHVLCFEMTAELYRGVEDIIL